MSQTHDRNDADHNLLFGVLALQVNFISRDALITAMQAWALARQKTLGQILIEQGKLNPGQVHALEALVVQHLQAHADDVKKSLSTLPEASIVRSTLATFEPGVTPASQTPAVAARADNGSTHFYVTTATPGGRFRRLRPHARGGLGEVFVAEDTELHREVALKEIKPEHADNPDSRGRFVLEAEITGGLEHPGIVPVYGLGAYANGRPYYAMRFIRGDSLKEAIERFHDADKPGRNETERAVAFRHLLRRYVDVCNAVAYAHSRGVLHRDLKPANIMLGKFGETLVVDWGLAKAGIKTGQAEVNSADADEPTLRPSSGSSVEKTQAGVAMGTTHFMSPEQAAGRIADLTPASDIFSLGSTLYVLLTGQRPFPGKHDVDVLAQVRRCEFTPPSELKPGVPRALGAICVKAMALKPADRYPSALALAADIERWLADEPVLAHPEPWTTRLGRWARRHRTGLVGAAVFLVSAVVALSISTGMIWAEQQKTAEQKRVAQENYLLARDLSFSGIDWIQAAEIDYTASSELHAKRKEVLTTGARAYRRFLEQEPNDVDLRTRAARVYRFAANVHRLEDETGPAIAHYADSIQLQEALLAEQPNDADRRLQLANTLRDQAGMLVKLGKLKEAAQGLEKATAMSEELRKADDQPAYRRSLALAQLDLASVQFTMGKTEESKKSAKSAADLFGGLLKVPADNIHPYDPLMRAAALNRVASAERELGKLKEARIGHAAAIKILQGMKDAQSAKVARPDILHNLALCIRDQARTLAKMPDKRADADKNLEFAIQQWGALAKAFPKLAHYQAYQANACLVRGELRFEDKKVESASKDFKDALTILETLVKEHADTPSYQADLGRTRIGMGRLAFAAANKDEAARWHADGIIALTKAAEASPDSVQIRRWLDEARAEQARTD